MAMTKPKPAPPDTISSELKQANSKIDRGISMILYGDIGLGKTTAATTLPVGETLIINTEAGLGPLLGTGHVVFNLKRDLTQLDDIYRYLRTENHPFKYIVFDNLSEFQDWILNMLVDLRKKDFPDIREHGDASFKMIEQGHLFRDLVEKGICIIFNAWEEYFKIKDDVSGVVEMKLGPKMYPKIVAKMCGIVDCVGHIEKYDKTGDRWVRFTPLKGIMAKTQFKGLDECEPMNMPGQGPGLKDIFDKMYAYKYDGGKP